MMMLAGELLRMVLCRAAAAAAAASVVFIASHSSFLPPVKFVKFITPSPLQANEHCAPLLSFSLVCDSFSG